MVWWGPRTRGCSRLREASVFSVPMAVRKRGSGDFRLLVFFSFLFFRRQQEFKLFCETEILLLNTGNCYKVVHLSVAKQNTAVIWVQPIGRLFANSIPWPGQLGIISDSSVLLKKHGSFNQAPEGFKLSLMVRY